VKDLGQLLVTSDRITGIVTHGSAGQVRLDGAAGSVYAFTAGMDDLQPAEVQAKRRGGLTGLVIRSRDGRPRFELHVTSMIGRLDDDGRLTFGASLADLLNSLTPESRSLVNPLPRQLLRTARRPAHVHTGIGRPRHVIRPS
jgi:hypothetical protein